MKTIMATLLRDTVSLLEQKRQAKLFGDRIAGTIIAAKSNVNVADVLQRHGRINVHQKETINPHTQTGQSALRQHSLAWQSVFMRRAVHSQLLEAGALAAPIGARIPRSTNDPDFDWEGEFKPLPATGMDFNNSQLKSAKLGGIVVITNELARFSDPSGLELINRIVARAAIASADAKLLSDDAEVEFQNPPGLLNGLSTVGDGSPAAIEETLLALVTAVSEGAWRIIMSPRGAVYLSTLRDGSDDLRFPTVNPVSGGSLLGIPVIVSKKAYANVILVNAEELAFDDSGLEISQSRVTAVQMSNTPTDGATNLVSMFQTDSTALKVVHYLTWRKLTDNAVAFFELPITASPAE